MFIVTFLLRNMTSSLQSMDENVINTLPLDEDNLEILLSFFKQMILKKRCYTVVDPQDMIERKILIKAWNKILKWEHGNSLTDTDDSVLEDINELMTNIHICKKCVSDDMKKQLTFDSYDQGVQIMSDDEIFGNKQTPGKQTKQRNTKIQKMTQDHLKKEHFKSWKQFSNGSKKRV